MNQPSPDSQNSLGASSQEKRLLIVLADLSGYTELMVASQTAAVHGQMVVSMLIEAILDEVEIPLHLQEIEGDAVFLYAEHPGTASGWQEVCEHVGQKLPRFFEKFAETIVLMNQATICRCAICRSDLLRIKVVVHSGVAVFHSIQGRPQVSGVDVIKAHRLLKNSVPSDEYILLSEAAHKDLAAQLDLKFTEGQENYDSLATVKTFVHIPNEFEAVRNKFYTQPPNRLALAGVRHAFRGTYESTKTLLKQQRKPVATAGRLSRLVYVTVMVISAPVMLIMLAVVTPIRLLIKKAAGSNNSSP